MEIVPNFSNFEFNESLISFICPIQPKQEGWSFEEDKLFENALAFFDLNSSEIFQKIAEMLPGKTIEQVKFHFDELVHDVKLIEADSHNVKIAKKKHNVSALSRDMIVPAKKGARWTKEEHERFLVGLNKYGKGDWRSISRNCVLTKTPTQVASHAQKYFIRIAKSSSTKSPPKQEVKNSKTKVGLIDQSQCATGIHVSSQLDTAAIAPNKRHKSA